MTALPAYQRPRLSPGQEQAVQLNLFGYLVKLRMREVLTTKETAEILRVSSDFILDLIQLGKFAVFAIKAKGKRKSAPEYRIEVRSFLVHLASVGTFSPEDWDDLLGTFVDKLDLPSLNRLLDLATRRRDRLQKL